MANLVDDEAFGARPLSAVSVATPEPRTSSRRERDSLVVDDAPIVRELLRHVLEIHYIVLEASDGLAALKVLRSRRVDLILLDGRAPGMSGIEMLSRLRPARRTTPVILISGAATGHDGGDGHETGGARLPHQAIYQRGTADTCS